MATVNSRRRAVTYGKTSRKPVTNLSPAAVDVFSQIIFTDEVRNISSLKLQTDFKKVSSNGMSNIQNMNVVQEHRHPPQYIPSSSSTSEGPGACSPLDKKDVIYDYPSSCEDSRQWCRAQGAVERKRRKITPEAESNGNAAFISRRLQAPRHVVGTKKSKKPESLTGRESSAGSIPKEPFLRRTHDKDRIRKSPARNKTRRQDPAPYTANNLACRHGLVDSNNAAGPQQLESRRELPKEMVTVTAARSVGHLSMPSETPGLPVVGEMLNEQQSSIHNSPLSTPLSGADMKTSQDQKFNKSAVSPHTPSKRSRSGAQVTTPHQRGLWNMLLPGDASNESPSGLNVPRPQLGSEMHRLSSKARNHCKEDSHGTPERPNRVNERRRLVDTLQGQNAAATGVGLDLDDETTSEEIESDDEINLPFGQENRIHSSLESHGSASSNDEQSLGAQSQDLKTDGNCQVPRVIPGSGMRATYARQRSYLTESGLSEAGIFDPPILLDSATDQRPRKEATQDTPKSLQPLGSLGEHVEETGDSQGPALRSIHELRKAGGNSRLVSEIEAITDDISDETPTFLSLRRNRLLELIRRLQESSFKQIFVDQSYESRLIARLETCSDAVETVLISAVFLECLTGPVTTRVLSKFNSPPVIKFLVGLLDMDQDITTVSKARTFNMSRMAHSELRDFCMNFLDSNVWSVCKPRRITAQALTLQCLECLVRHARGAGSVDSMLPHNAVSRITRVLVDSPRITPLHPSEEPHAEFQLALSILESYTIASRAEFDSAVWSGSTLESILGLLPSLDSRFTGVAESLRSLTLRLYLNLTNNNPELCEAFSRPDVLRSIFDTVISHFSNVTRDGTAQALILDSLILSLGTLINLAEWCESVRQSSLDLHFQGSTYLDWFLQLFINSEQKTAEVGALIFGREQTSKLTSIGFL